MVPNHTTTKVQLPPRHPVTKLINTWTVCVAAILFGFGSLYMAALKHHPARSSQPYIPDATPVSATIAPPPAPAQIAARAELVTGPLTSTGVPMLSGNQYYVTMPDGRHILINYKGWVEHANNLPAQPKGGANNAAYTDTATGHMWIWTVPAGTSNVPQWIDP
jgi:hypothetical protein